MSNKIQIKHKMKLNTRFISKPFVSKIIILSLCLFFSAIAINGQVEKSSELFKTLQENDRLLFEEGFNKCDISQFEKLISEDMEFYHDQSGIMTSKEQFMANTRNVLCKKGAKKNDRVLVKDSLQVFPLYDNGKLYGAIQIGIHRFGNSSAKFTHLWILEHEKWQLTRVLSYDHKADPEPVEK